MPPTLRKGVLKLGSSVAAYSREVGRSCPKDCPFLTGRVSDGSEIPPKLQCYAEKIQKRRPNCRKAWASNTDRTRTKEWAEQFARELQKETMVRVHVGGDFMLDGEIDFTYLKLFCGAVETARKAGWTGEIYLYTHAWRDLFFYWFAKTFRNLKIHAYASVHTEEESLAARRMGWLLAIDGDNAKVTHFHGHVRVWGVKALSCPEQMKGHAKVTCSTCRWCVRGKGHVVFWRHV